MISKWSLWSSPPNDSMTFPRTQREHTGNQDLLILRKHLNYMVHPCMPLMETSPQIGGLIVIRVQLPRTLVDGPFWCFELTTAIQRWELSWRGVYVVTSSFCFFFWIKTRGSIFKPRQIFHIIFRTTTLPNASGNGLACPFHNHRLSSAFGSYKTRTMTTHPSAA